MVQQTTVTHSRKKRDHHKKKDVRIKGPKFRHPPEPAPLNVMFSGIGEGDKADIGRGFARLYRDMIRYSISPKYYEMRQKQKEQGEPLGFKIKNIGYWLLDHNPDYIDYYSDSKSKTPGHKKQGYIVLANIRQTLKSYLEHLQKWGIIKRLQDVDAESGNGTKTPLYGYGRVGMIIAQILEYHDKSDFDRKQEAKNKIFYLIQNMFKDPRVYNAYKTDFLAEFYHKLIEYDNNNYNNQPGICDVVIRQVLAAMKNEDDIHAKAINCLKNVLKIILLNPAGDLQIKHTILRLYLQTLKDVPEDTRRMTMRHDKTFFESKMEMAIPDKKWSDMCEENIDKYDKITMCCTCQNRECSHSYHNKFYSAITFDYYSYISALSLSAEDSYSQIDCPKCKAHKSLHVYGTMDDLIDEAMNSSF